MKTLTPEQTGKIKKLNRKFIVKMSLYGFGYGTALFFGNLFFAILNKLYFHDDDFFRFGSFGTTMIIFFGFSSTIRECRDMLLKDIEIVLANINH